MKVGNWPAGMTKYIDGGDDADDGEQVGNRSHWTFSLVDKAGTLHAAAELA